MNITNCINQSALKKALNIPNGSLATSNLLKLSKAVQAIEDYMKANPPQIETTNTIQKRSKTGSDTILNFSKFQELYKTKNLATEQGAKEWQRLDKELRKVVKQCV